MHGILCLVLIAWLATGCPPGSAKANDDGADGVTPAVIAWGQWRATDGNFVYPRGIAVVPSTADSVDPAGIRVHVVDKTRRMQTFDGTGRLLAVHPVAISPEPDLKGFPVGLAVSPLTGEVLAANTHYSELIRYRGDGAELQRRGEYGQADGQFVFPVRIAFRPDGGYYVSEYGHNQHRIQRFTASGTHVATFGHQGDGDGGFDRPNGCVFVPVDRRLYVCDVNHHRIQVFDEDGNFLRTFGQFDEPRGRADGLMLPMGIGYDATHDRLLVAEFAGSRLAVFRRDGTPLGHYTGGDLANPWDIACSAGFAFVPDYRNHRVVRIALDALPGAGPLAPPADATRAAPFFRPLRPDPVPEDARS